MSPSTLLFVLGTDSKYNHEIICKRWDYIKVELLKREINVISFGADEAGPFMKAMLCETFLFKKNDMDLNWTFLEMPMKTSGLYNQYTVHLLAKLRNKLLTSSNLIVIGNKVACPSHLKTLINDIPNSDHGLTRKAINNKAKLWPAIDKALYYA